MGLSVLIVHGDTVPNTKQGRVLDMMLTRLLQLALAWFDVDAAAAALAARRLPAAEVRRCAGSSGSMEMYTGGCREAA